MTARTWTISDLDGRNSRQVTLDQFRADLDARRPYTDAIMRAVRSRDAVAVAGRTARDARPLPECGLLPRRSRSREMTNETHEQLAAIRSAMLTALRAHDHAEYHRLGAEHRRVLHAASPAIKAAWLACKVAQS